MKKFFKQLLPTKYESVYYTDDVWQQSTWYMWLGHVFFHKITDIKL